MQIGCTGDSKIHLALYGPNHSANFDLLSRRRLRPPDVSSLQEGGIRTQQFAQRS